MDTPSISPWFWPYGTIFWTLGGGYASAVAVGFAVVTAKSDDGTTRRWIAILSMELMLVLPSLSQYLVGEIIGKFAGEVASEIVVRRELSGAE